MSRRRAARRRPAGKELAQDGASTQNAPCRSRSRAWRVRPARGAGWHRLPAPSVAGTLEHLTSRPADGIASIQPSVDLSRTRRRGEGRRFETRIGVPRRERVAVSEGAAGSSTCQVVCPGARCARLTRVRSGPWSPMRTQGFTCNIGRKRCRRWVGRQRPECNRCTDAVEADEGHHPEVLGDDRLRARFAAIRASFPRCLRIFPGRSSRRPTRSSAPTIVARKRDEAPSRS